MAWSPQARQAALIARRSHMHGGRYARRNAARQMVRVGTVVHPTVNHSTGHVGTKAYAAYDSKYNQRKRRGGAIKGAIVGTALMPGAGTYVGAMVGHNMAAKKHGVVLRPITKARPTTRGHTHGAKVKSKVNTARMR